MSRKYRQGLFRPKNPKKYKGDPTNIVFRSSYEKIVFIWLDNNESCIEWGSEEFFIEYISPVDHKIHRYFPDIKATFKTSKGIKTYIIEIKPYIQTIPPNPSRGKSKKTLLEENITYAINEAKWNSAIDYCNKKGYEFKILDEYGIGIKKRK